MKEDVDWLHREERREFEKDPTEVGWQSVLSKLNHQLISRSNLSRFWPFGLSEYERGERLRDYDSKIWALVSGELARYEAKWESDKLENLIDVIHRIDLKLHGSGIKIDRGGTNEPPERKQYSQSGYREASEI